MRTTPTREQLQYLASLGVTLGTSPVAPMANPVMPPMAVPVAVACPPSAPLAVLIQVAAHAPATKKSWWKANSWLIGLAGSAALLLLKLFFLILMKGCNS